MEAVQLVPTSLQRGGQMGAGPSPSGWCWSRSAPLWDRNEEERQSASLAAPRVAAKTKGLDEESRRDLGPQPVVDIQVQILLEGCP